MEEKLKPPKRNEIDPDFFDVLIQSLSVLSNIATLAGTWAMLAQATQRRRDAQNDANIQDALRNLQRSLEDTFEEADQILRLLDVAFSRAGPRSLLDEIPKFGTSVVLDNTEMTTVYPHLQKLAFAAHQSRNYASLLVQLLSHSAAPSEEQINFNLDSLNDDLNDILFNSKTIGEAMTKLRLAKQRASKFLTQVTRIVRGN
jgi:hypothetical protein